MANKTKTELLNEISALERQKRVGDKALLEYAKEISNLRDYIQARFVQHDEMSNEIKQLRLGQLADRETIRVKTNEIAELQSADGVYLAAEVRAIRELRSEIKELEAASNSRAATIVELRNDCSNLSADKAILSGLQHDYRNEIKELEAVSDSRLVTIVELRNEIHRMDAVVCASTDDIEQNLKEIKDLHDSVRQRDALITGKDKEVAHLHVLLDADEKVFDKKDNEIKQLRLEQIAVQEGQVWQLRNKIKQLRAQASIDSKVLSAQRNEIKELRDALHMAIKASLAKHNEIKELRAGVEVYDALCGDDEKDHEIKQLRACCDEWSLLSDRKDKEFKYLKAEKGILSDHFAEKDNEIKNLHQEVATLRDYSDKQADVIRHYVNNNAELAKTATNLQHFRRFSND